ncbi:Co-chaperone Hsc20 [Aspergillus sclerotiicarbonarius CBS 121057]|uniref:Co-chaperone Hsc20 n=1 Tax=Aspergillus sclerotiicarbonarius (strain CBS 121057 / IBT 28362) TaxID=1448318 RepID=A0A319EED3_ASPSB|nr:Co-chaperone Hsc20 [Aspergillus sclerotiicarbonarius CBS 121057]
MFNRRLASRVSSARVLQSLTPASQAHNYLRPHLRTQLPTASASAPPTLRFASTQPPSPTPNDTASNTPDITNHYTIFKTTLPAGPPPASPFDIPTSSLRREFLQLQGRIHPDKYPQGPQKQSAEALSARINEAYRTLLDPLQRAQYLLREIHGIDVTAEDGASKHALDPETLMEVMEVQETIEEVSGDPGAEARIMELKKENEGRVEECVRVLGEAFDKGDIELARRECVRLRFWYSVGEGLREWEPGMVEIRLVH